MRNNFYSYQNYRSHLIHNIYVYQCDDISKYQAFFEMGVVFLTSKFIPIANHNTNFTMALKKK